MFMENSKCLNKTSTHSIEYFQPSSCIIGIMTGQVGLGVGSWSSNRGIESQGNPIILRDLTQECRKNISLALI